MGRILEKPWRSAGDFLPRGTNLTQQSDTLVADEHGNFDSPVLQSLQEVWDDYDQQTVEAGEVLRVIGNVEAYVKGQIEQMERGAESPEVNPNDPNRLAILSSFHDHLRGLELMRSFFDSEDDGAVEEGFQIIQTATNLMVRGFQGLVEEAELVAPKLCIRCQSENDQQATNCRQCGTILPVLTELAEKPLIGIDGNEQDENAETTPNFIEVSDAHQSWKSGHLPAEQFVDKLETVRARQLAEHQSTLVAYRESEQAGSDGEQLRALENLVRSIERGVEALDAMAQAVEDGHQAGVEDGFSDFAEATIELLAAQKELGEDSDGEEA